MNGMAPSYSLVYNEKLRGHLSPHDYNAVLEEINETVQEYWPCCFCLCVGYALSPCTIGIRFKLREANLL